MPVWHLARLHRRRDRRCPTVHWTVGLDSSRLSPIVRIKTRPTPMESVLFLWSGRRGSNSLPPPWQGGALPDELRPQRTRRIIAEFRELSSFFSKFIQEFSQSLPQLFLSVLFLHFHMRNNPIHSPAYRHRFSTGIDLPHCSAANPHGNTHSLRR